MSPSDISCSIRLARMSAWFKATSTWKVASKSQALRGLLMQAMVRGTLNLSRARKHRARFSASPGRQAASHLGAAHPRVFEDVGIGAVALVDDLGGQLPVQMRQHLASMLHEPHLVVLGHQERGELGPGAAAAGDDDEHGLQASFAFGEPPAKLRRSLGRVALTWSDVAGLERRLAERAGTPCPPG